MANKTATQQRSNNFDNLKFLGGVISGKDIADVFVNIKTAKQGLDGFCKKIKNKKDAIVLKDKGIDAGVVQKSVAQTTEVKQQQKTAFTPSAERTQYSNNRPAQNSNQRPAYSNQRPAYSNQGSSYPNQRPQADQRQNSGQRPYAGQRPQGSSSDVARQPYKKPALPPKSTTSYTHTSSGGAKQNFARSYDNRTPRPAGDTRPGGVGARPGVGARQGAAAPGARRPGAGTGAQPVKTDRFGKPESIISFTNAPATKGSAFGKGKKKSTKTDGSERGQGLNMREKIRMGHSGFDKTRMDDSITYVKGKPRRQKAKKQIEKIDITNAVISEELITVREFSEKIGRAASEIIKKFLLLGQMHNINSVIDYQTAELIAAEFGVTLERKVEKTSEEKLLEMYNQELDENTEFIKRPPVVTVMGHVDHGKTSLLDYIKKSHILQTEAGGITQHIGAYSVSVNGERITFIDTPGHEAFSHMRERGANVADIAILVVAADDGIMPQTKEAVKHIREANIPMVIAINKIDKPTANIERIKQQLTEVDVLVEEWGGDTIYVPISAKTGEGIDSLLENILLVADIHEFKANENASAQATCIESKVETGKGIVANVIIKDGTLNVGDYVICGLSSGRVRAMIDYTGESVKSAGPSMAVSLVGLNAVPEAGDMLYVVDERFAKTIISERSNKIQIEKTQTTSASTLEAFLSQNADEQMKVYKVIVKADVQGTSEALKEQLEAIKNEEVIVSVISSSVGIINESDVLLAKVSGAQIIAFNTKIDAKARQVADKNGVDIKTYKVIYDATDFVSAKIEGMKTPKYKDVQIGKAEVRQIFKVSSLGVIAGSYVLEGKITRTSAVVILRNGVEIGRSTIETLQQQKDQAKEVRSGFECGIKIKGFNNLAVGDIIVANESVRIS